MVQSDPWEGVPYTPTSSGSTRQLMVFQAAVAARTRGLGGEDLRVALEEALAARQRSETQVRQFVADASHELRTPLASVQGYAQLARRDIGEASRTQAL